MGTNCVFNKRIAHPIKILFCNSCALYTFKNAFPVVAHVLDTLQDDGDDKAGMHLAAILRFEFVDEMICRQLPTLPNVSYATVFSKTFSEADIIQMLTPIYS
jgi:hypothetical protein